MMRHILLGALIVLASWWAFGLGVSWFASGLAWLVARYRIDIVLASGMLLAFVVGLLLGSWLEHRHWWRENPPRG